jgi:hypothetical protein
MHLPVVSIATAEPLESLFSSTTNVLLRCENVTFSLWKEVP